MRSRSDCWSGKPRRTPLASRDSRPGANESGYFDGLTSTRGRDTFTTWVVTNFVVQGGSPGHGANEYSLLGAAGIEYVAPHPLAYMRDELGLVPGTGAGPRRSPKRLGRHPPEGATRRPGKPRSIGDGQIFINLVDNLRLNHDYTVFGEVVSGMDVTDQVAEGDVIVRATVVVVE